MKNCALVTELEGLKNIYKEGLFFLLCIRGRSQAKAQSYAHFPGSTVIPIHFNETSKQTSIGLCCTSNNVPRDGQELLCLLSALHVLLCMSLLAVPGAWPWDLALPYENKPQQGLQSWLKEVMLFIVFKLTRLAVRAYANLFRSKSHWVPLDFLQGNWV